jgi:YIF1
LISRISASTSTQRGKDVWKSIQSKHKIDVASTSPPPRYLHLIFYPADIKSLSIPFRRSGLHRLSRHNTAPATNHPPPPGSQYAQQFGQYLGVNDATAQMGLHVMGNALGTSHEYMQQNVLRFFNTTSLKPYFNVSTSYVARKLRLLVFPWRHKPWARQMRRNEVSGVVEGYKSPREDINAPDLYIPGTLSVEVH